MPKFKRDWSETLKKMGEQNSGNKNFQDERIYKPEFKEDGSAKAIIRFLEAPDVDLPVVKSYEHYFRGEGGWFKDACPTSIGRDCPVCEDNSKHWNAGREDFVRQRRSTRNLHYHANILVIKDEKNPSNEGKVFLYRFGKKIYEKLEDAMKEGFVPWDDNAGINFNLRVKKVKVGKNMLPNYDSSNFSDTETELAKYGDAEKINAETYNLSEFIEESRYKSYDELKAKLDKVLRIKSSEPTTDAPVEIKEEEPAPAPKAEEAAPIEETEVFDSSEEEDFFNDDLD